MNLKQSSHKPIVINVIFIYLCPSAEIYRNWIKLSNTKLNTGEFLKIHKVIDFLFFLLFLMNRHHSSWLLGCFGFYFFKSCRCWTRGSDMHRIFSQLYLFWPISVSNNQGRCWPNGCQNCIVVPTPSNIMEVKIIIIIINTYRG